MTPAPFSPRACGGGRALREGVACRHGCRRNRPRMARRRCPVQRCAHCGEVAAQPREARPRPAFRAMRGRDGRRRNARRNTKARLRSTPAVLRGFPWLLDASRGHGRSLSRLQLAHMPVSTARLGPVRSDRRPGTPGPSVKTRTERRSAGSRQTSTRTCSAGGRSTRDAGESRVAARSHERALAIADGAVASTPEPVAAAGRPGRSRVSGHAASSQTRDSQVSHSPFSAVWVAARPLRLLSNLDVWKRPCQAPAFVVVQESAPRA